MSHTSPASYLIWAILTGLLMSFLLFHLWSFDRFRCLRWNNGPYSGAFKRIMTYSYMITVPLIFCYALGYCIIKYHEGYVDLPFYGIVPKPYQLWDPLSRSAIFPLTLIFSVAWSFEMVTHLEELCFWLFLVNAGSAQQDWFRSLYFRTWVFGSCLAVIYMPLVTILTRSDPLKSEAYLFLAGSLGSLSLTLWFTPVLWTFPSFLDSLRREGVDSSTIIRLTKFHELNTIRVIFRFLFVCPLVILGVDGVRPHVHINENMLATDFLTMIAGFGVAVSSGITLVIFFPRSIEGEIAAKDASRERRRNRSLGMSQSMMETTQNMHTQHSNYSQSFIESQNPTYLLTSSPVKQTLSLAGHSETHNLSQHGQSLIYEPGSVAREAPSPYGANNTHRSYDEREEDDAVPNMTKLPAIRPNRRVGNDIELGGMDRLTEQNVSVHNLNLSASRSNFNPFVHNFTSPIDLAYASNSMERINSGQTANGSRLTFNRRR